MTNNSNLSEAINRMGESQTIAMAQKTRELRSQGLDIISLSVGEPDFPTPDYIKEAAKKAIDDNFTYYTPVAGIPDLKTAIVNKLKRENNLDYKPEQIIVSTGAKHALMNAIVCVVNSGDEVIIPAPYWVSYIEFVNYVGGVNVILPTSVETNFKITAQQLETAITPKTKAVLFSSPSNPSGALYSIEELKEIAMVVAKHPSIYIISDEIYEYINFTGKVHASIAQFDAIKDQVLLINGVSKGYAMTGWRIGYMAGPKAIVTACTKLQGQFTSGACSIAQKAAVAAINTGYNVDVAKMCDSFRCRRDLALSLIKDIPLLKTGRPDGAFYIFADVSAYFGKSFGNEKINNAYDLTLFLLSHAHIACVSGEAFGDPNCIRISYATSDELLTKAFNRMNEALLHLK